MIERAKDRRSQVGPGFTSSNELLEWQDKIAIGVPFAAGLSHLLYAFSDSSRLNQAYEIFAWVCWPSLLLGVLYSLFFLKNWQNDLVFKITLIQFFLDLPTLYALCVWQASNRLASDLFGYGIVALALLNYGVYFYVCLRWRSIATGISGVPQARGK